MGLFHGTYKVHDRQKHKNECLNETNQNTQEQDGQWCQIETCQHKEDAQHDLFAHNITKKPDAERHDPGKVADQFKNDHQRGQPQDGPQEMFDILGAVKLDSDGVCEHKCANGQRQGSIEAGSGGEETGHQTDEIGCKDE